MLSFGEQKDFLDRAFEQFNSKAFIKNDPISIPHRFSKKEDIEIAGFLTATISWGQRPSILKSGNQLMAQMDENPHDFIIHHTEKDLKPFRKFVYRTFQGIDCVYFLKALKHLYLNHGGIHQLISENLKKENNEMQRALFHFRKIFFELQHESRTEKHLANPMENSAAKRINMFLRWMVRKDEKGVDFGIWKDISPSLLFIPLDVHTGNVARELSLLKRKQDDWKAVKELTENLRTFDAMDPVKYDFALFGSGIHQNLQKHSR
jgi:uncharacterized protein (TIGR02757 family)